MGEGVDDSGWLWVRRETMACSMYCTAVDVTLLSHIAGSQLSRPFTHGGRSVCQGCRVCRVSSPDDDVYSQTVRNEFHRRTRKTGGSRHVVGWIQLIFAYVPSQSPTLCLHCAL